MKDKKVKCEVEGCLKKGKISKQGVEIFVKGYCPMHYKRFKKYGSPLIRKRIFTGSRTLNPLYKTYQMMHQRCENIKHNNYCFYGACGISVCKRWSGDDGLENFSKDMGERPDGMTLDRINPYGNYEPFNCRWATFHQQSSNLKNNKEVVGVTFSKDRNKYVAVLIVKGIKVLQKRFNTYEDAVKARKEAEKQYKIKI